MVDRALSGISAFFSGLNCNIPLTAAVCNALPKERWAATSGEEEDQASRSGAGAGGNGGRSGELVERNGAKGMAHLGRKKGGYELGIRDYMSERSISTSVRILMPRATLKRCTFSAKKSASRVQITSALPARAVPRTDSSA